MGRPRRPFFEHKCAACGTPISDVERAMLPTDVVRAIRRAAGEALRCAVFEWYPCAAPDAPARFVRRGAVACADASDGGSAALQACAQAALAQEKAAGQRAVNSGARLVPLLAQLEILRAEKGDSPVLLLDDVFSELDRNRQKMLLIAAQDCQTFLSCTHLEEVAAAGVEQMQVYQVANRHVVEL